MGDRFEESPIFAIVPILESYGGDPPSSGRSWAPCKCPFHQERSASATVNVAAQRFNCFVCLERSEDAIGLVMWADGVDYKRAVEICETITSSLNDPGKKKPGGMSSMFG